MNVKNIVNRQINFQANMKSNSQVMKMALLEELGEFIASTGFADWKKTVRDEANMDIELIDMAVFAINVAYYEDNVRELYAAPTVTHEHDLIDKIVEMYHKGQWIDITYMIFAYNPELLKVIVAKQALNTLRQDYGYRQGEYIKDWNGQEDNTYLEGFYGQNFEEVYAGMEEIYTDKILASRLVNVHD